MIWRDSSSSVNSGPRQRPSARPKRNVRVLASHEKYPFLIFSAKEDADIKTRLANPGVKSEPTSAAAPVDKGVAKKK